MKKSILFWIGVLVVTLSTGLSSCNTDGESDFNTGNVNYESNPINLNGTWHMVSASFGFGGTVEYRASEISVTFDEATKTMNVENKKNTAFLKSGSFSYEITTERRQIYTYQWVDVEYQVVVIHYSVEASGNRDVRYIYSFHDGMLVLDSGMASDGPGYYLKKLI